MLSNAPPDVLKEHLPHLINLESASAPATPPRHSAAAARRKVHTSHPALKPASPLRLSADECFDRAAVRRVLRRQRKRFGLQSRAQVLAAVRQEPTGAKGDSDTGTPSPLRRSRPRSSLEREIAPPAGLTTAAKRATTATARAGPLSALVAEGTVQLSAAQERVLALVRAGRSVFFTGSAGTGKSLLLRLLVEQLPAETTAACATTGIAACNIGGVTVHQFAGIGRGGGDADETASRVARSREAVLRWRHTRTLIIDEVSMLSRHDFETLDAVARRVRRSPDPFGGLQIVLVGDFFQLPPVASAGEVAGGSARCAFAFESPLWGTALDASIALSRVFRQRDDAFADALGHVRCGRLPPEAERLFDACVRRDFSAQTAADGIEATHLFTHRTGVDRMNAAALQRLPGLEREFAAEDSGPEVLRRALDTACPADRVLRLKVGAQVMLIRSIDPRSGLVNGARGVVVRFTGAAHMPVVRFAARAAEVVVGQEEWRVGAGALRSAARRQLPLRLAWAMSVHKAQGMTLDRVQMDLSKVFACGQAYVALSRVRTLAGLSLRAPLRPAHVNADPRAVAFYASLRDHE